MWVTQMQGATMPVCSDSCSLAGHPDSAFRAQQRATAPVTASGNRSKQTPLSVHSLPPDEQPRVSSTQLSSHT